MDPWSTCQTLLKSSVNGTETVVLAFEDNFKPLVRHSLPDSAEYLAILGKNNRLIASFHQVFTTLWFVLSAETRLEKLKSDPDVLRQLAEKREACMRQLLSNGEPIYADAEENLRLEEPIEESAILRAVAPHKQALTHGETVELVQYDQLANEE